MLDEKDMAVTPPAVAPRDDDGALRAEYVEQVVKALEPATPARCASWSATCTRPTPAL